MEKSFTLKNLFAEKTFFTEKNVKICISFEKYIFIQKILVTNKI